MKYPFLICAVAFTSVFMTFTAGSHAQTKLQSKIEDRVTTAVKKVEAACGEDLRKFCSTVTPGEGRVLLSSKLTRIRSALSAMSRYTTRPATSTGRSTMSP